MRITENNLNTNFNRLSVSKFWSNEINPELKMHKIHAYPAKFPSLVIAKSLSYAKKNNFKINKIADIFCGCGTTALEAKINNIDFWGCDINPVATLIAKVKSKNYSEIALEFNFLKVLEAYNTTKDNSFPIISDDRISYWFPQNQLNDLSKLLFCVRKEIENEQYLNFFLCAFSNILKGCSKWLTKSIKPQIDPVKVPKLVIDSFKDQYGIMLKANQQLNRKVNGKSNSEIINMNFLDINIQEPFIDLLITSPPYVTSYEYADLHQLSSLMLGYTNDYKELRKGSIGSLSNNELSEEDYASLNQIAKPTIEKLYQFDKSKARSVAKYFIDMNTTIQKSYNLLNSEGLMVIVIGNTKYQGVEVNNAKFLCLSMMNIGFKQVDIFKRKINSKILTPYRDSKGKFSNNSKDRKVYSHEFVIVGKK